MKQHLILLITAIGLYSCQSNPTQESQSLQGKVKLEPISLASKIAGRVESIRVEEGQTVHAGDTLLIIGVPEIASKLEQAEGAIEAAAGQLDLAVHGATADQFAQLQGQLDAATAQEDFAQHTYNRLENMFRDSLIPAQQFDEARSKCNMAKAQVQALQAKMKEMRAGTRPETIVSAKGQLQRAEGARNEILQADKERYLIAASDMMIETVSVKPGELATPGYTLISGYDTHHACFRFTVGEHSVRHWQTGQTVSVSMPGSGKKMESRITAVKQLPRYADNTSTAPNREVAEGFYELKLVPVNDSVVSGLYNNATVFLQ